MHDKPHPGQLSPPGPENAGEHFPLRSEGDGKEDGRPASPSGATAGLPRTRRGLIVACICLGMFMTAMEATVVATAMPNIVGKLGGLPLYSWVFSAFLLAQGATTVIYGKLADLYGRRPVIIAGLAIFLAGSVACGYAWSIEALILFRLLQGVGAGSIQPVGLTIIADLYPGNERAAVQGYLASVWGISGVMGPVIGGLIVERFSWPWVFWVNVPIALLAMGGFALCLSEDVERKPHRLDFAGAGLFVVVISAFLIFLTALGDGDRLLAIGAAAAFVLLAPVFIWQERRAPEPIMSLKLWARPLLALTNLTVLAVSMTLIGVTICVPLYVQLVMNRSAIEAGLAMSMVLVGWPVASILAWRLFGWIGMRATGRLGSVVLAAGAVILLTITTDDSLVLAGAATLVIGAGMGLLNTSCINLIQRGTDRAERGAATASNVFSRTIGAMLGAAFIGGILTAMIDFFGRRQGISVPAEDLLGQAQSDGEMHVLAEPVRLLFSQSLTVAFSAITVFALIGFFLTWRIPK